MRRLSKQEAKYRMKLMQEGHYNKTEQRIMDEAVAGSGRSYKKTYLSVRQGRTFMFMATIAAARAAKAFRAVGCTIREASEAISKFAESVKKTDKAEGGTTG